MIPFLQLIRYKNLFMVLLTMVLTKYALIHSFIEKSNLSNLEFCLLSLSVLLITAGGYIINDVFDIEADRINKPKKVFIDVSISKKKAFYIYLILSFTGLFTGIYISFSKGFQINSLIFIFTFLGLIFYSKNLKKVALIGNLIVSVFISFVILIVFLFEKGSSKSTSIWGAIDSIFSSISLFYFLSFYIIFSFLLTLIREIIKDMEDIKGDKALKMKTLPIILGRKRSKSIALVLVGILMSVLIIWSIDSIQMNSIYFFKYTTILITLPLCYFFSSAVVCEVKKRIYCIK
jgi:4-hydroxybenzoate polyprenyltransferase